jgi:hypothetical protein
MPLSNEFNTLRSFFLWDCYSTYNLPVNKDIVQIGGNDEGVNKTYTFADIGGLYNFTCNIKENKNSVQVTVLGAGETDCGIIYIDRTINIALIHSISYHKSCAKEGLMKPGGGGILLKFMINFIIWHKQKYDVKRIALRDNSYLACENSSDTVKLARLKMLTSGKTWYMKYGFKPYDSYEQKPNKDLMLRYIEDAKTVQKLTVKDIDVVKLAEKDIKKEVKKLAELYPRLKDFVRVIAMDLNTYCSLVDNILSELYGPKRKLLEDPFEKSVYLDI